MPRYHGDCVGVSEDEADAMGDWLCPVCLKARSSPCPPDKEQSANPNPLPKAKAALLPTTPSATMSTMAVAASPAATATVRASPLPTKRVKREEEQSEEDLVNLRHFTTYSFDSDNSSPQGTRAPNPSVMSKVDSDSIGMQTALRTPTLAGTEAGTIGDNSCSSSTAAAGHLHADTDAVALDAAAVGGTQSVVAVSAAAVSTREVLPAKKPRRMSEEAAQTLLSIIGLARR